MCKLEGMWTDFHSGFIPLKKSNMVTLQVLLPEIEVS